MKSFSLGYNFTVNIWPHIWEVEETISPFFEGIIEVILNKRVGIVFVPEIDRESVYWPPLLPDDIENIHSKLEARLITLAMESYTVTPNSALAGQEERIPPFTAELEERVIFYVTPEEFNFFSQELNTLSQEIGRVDRGRYASELQDFKFVQFILTRVIISKNFSNLDKWSLGMVK